MHKGCPDAGVPQGQGLPWPLLQRCILRPPRPVAVGGPGLVQHKGHSEGEAEQLSPGGLFPAPSALFPRLSTSPPRERFLHLCPPYFPSPRRKTTLAKGHKSCSLGEKILYLVLETWIQILTLLLTPEQVTWPPLRSCVIICTLGWLLSTSGGGVWASNETVLMKAPSRVAGTQ